MKASCPGRVLRELAIVLQAPGFEVEEKLLLLD